MSVIQIVGMLVSLLVVVVVIAVDHIQRRSRKNLIVAMELVLSRAECALVDGRPDECRRFVRLVREGLRDVL